MWAQIVCRSQSMLSDGVIAKVSNFCHVKQKQVSGCVNVYVYDAVKFDSKYTAYTKKCWIASFVYCVEPFKELT